MTSNRPYLIRALYEWITDNGFTPYLLVDASREDVLVPAEFVEEGRIVLNVSPGAVRGLQLGNELIHFGARFSGSAMEVHLPPAAVLGVYARENGKGMLFPEEGDDGSPPDSGPAGPGPQPRRPSLKVVK